LNWLIALDLTPDDCDSDRSEKGTDLLNCSNLSEKGTDLLNCSNLELNNKSVPFFRIINLSLFFVFYVVIRDDAGGHDFGDGNSQNRGSHFNDESGNHYDY
jgi:hypothetical protein